jgi:AcrR family transcriptional regulator
MPPKTRFSRDDIVEAAFSVVRKHGWTGLSARSIAQELNSSTQPIYSHIKSIKNLKEEVVKKAYELLFSYGTTKRTGDPWLDVGVGYVLFAKKEKQLFRCLFDEEHLPLVKKYSAQSFAAISETLSDYPPFQELSKEERHKIRSIGFIFAHGLAVLANSSFTKNLNSEQEIARFIRMTDQIILKGFEDYLEECKKKED